MPSNKATPFEFKFLEQLWKLGLASVRRAKMTKPAEFHRPQSQAKDRLRGMKSGVLACIVACQSLVAQGAAAFDVASIRPSQPGNQPVLCNTLPGGRFVCHNVKAEFFLKLAFDPKPVAIKGAPAWLEDLYDLDAKAEGAGEMTDAELAPPMLALLRDRFGFVAHQETIRRTVYILEQLRSGAKVKPSAPGIENSIRRSDENVLLKGETMADFAGLMARRPDVNTTVIDNTGLAGKFDFTVACVDIGGNGNAPADSTVTPEIAKRTAAAFSSTFDALNSIGLRLRPEKRDGTALVIDQIHRPSAN
jgi:uncharacterized protein (TIGR03435 family)